MRTIVSSLQATPRSRSRKPKLRAAFVCPGSQSDVTVYGNLLFVSAEAVSGRVDCGLGGVQEEVSKDRARGIRIIDISDEKNPKVISDLRLEVHQPENRAAIADDPGAQNPVQGYAGHYCNVPTRTDPTIVACSMIISGLRIFDIRDPAHPREVAYFNAPVRDHVAAAFFEPSPWAMSSPSFVPERKEIWYSDGFNGFFVVRVTNDVWK